MFKQLAFDVTDEIYMIFKGIKFTIALLIATPLMKVTNCLMWFAFNQQTELKDCGRLTLFQAKQSLKLAATIRAGRKPR